MKKIFKKNQIIVTVLAILIVIAGYLKYTDANFNNKNKEVTNEIYESTYGTDDILSNGELQASMKMKQVKQWKKQHFSREKL